MRQKQEARETQQKYYIKILNVIYQKLLLEQTRDKR